MVAAIQSRTRAAQTPVCTIDDVKALSERNQEPAWLRESRLAAWELYEGMPMPGRNDEAWRRTDYRGIRWEEAGRTIAAPGGLHQLPPESLEPLIGDEQGGMIVFVDGKLVQFDLHPSLAAQGVIVADLLTAARKHEDLVRPRLMTQAVLPHEGKFAALHAALWTHGVFIYVPRNVAVERPIHVVMYNSQPGQTMGHMLVALDENAQATVLVDYVSATADEQSLYVGATELLVGDYANLKYVCLQDWNRDTYEFSTLRAPAAKQPLAGGDFEHHRPIGQRHARRELQRAPAPQAQGLVLAWERVGRGVSARQGPQGDPVHRSLRAGPRQREPGC